MLFVVKITSYNHSGDTGLRKVSYVILSDSEESLPSRSESSRFGAKPSLVAREVGILHSVSLRMTFLPESNRYNV